MNYPDRVYADSAGWADICTPRLERGDTFIWAGRHWQIMGHFTPPCCPDAKELHLIGRYPSKNPMIWRGTPCTSCDLTYTVQAEEK